MIPIIFAEFGFIGIRMDLSELACDLRNFAKNYITGESITNPAPLYNIYKLLCYKFAKDLW
jgi:hypothetical protein